MKKFTRICLTTALVLFIAGCALLLIFGFLGGFKQMEELDEAAAPFNKYIDLDMSGVIREIRGETYTSSESKSGKTQENEKSGAGTAKSDSRNDNSSADNSVVGEGQDIPAAERTNLNLTAKDITKLKCEVGACSFYIDYSDDDCFWIAMQGDTNRVKYKENSHTLEIKTDNFNKKWGSDWSDISKKLKIYLYVPKECRFDKIDMNVGAGYATSVLLKAEEVDAECDAGEFKFAGFDADKVEIEVGAGRAVLSHLNADEAKFKVGAGEVVATDLYSANKLVLDIGMGSGTIEGTVEGDLDADCGMGNLDMKLTGSEEDHTYDIDCAMGSVEINHRNYAGITDSKFGDSDSKFDIDCSMGMVRINFDEN